MTPKTERQNGQDAAQKPAALRLNRNLRDDVRQRRYFASLDTRTEKPHGRDFVKRQKLLMSMTFAAESGALGYKPAQCKCADSRDMRGAGTRRLDPARAKRDEGAEAKMPG